MIVAGFDIATTTGCAVLDGSRVLHVEAFKAGGDKEAEVFRGFRRWFRHIIKTHDVQRIATEQPLVTNIKKRDDRPGAEPGATYNPLTMKTYLRLYGLRTLAIVEASVLEVPLIEVHQMTWRKSFTGNPRASKEDTLALAQRIVPGLKSLDAAEAIGIAWHLNGVLRSEKLSAAAGDAEPCLL
jgi:hypothetical protein